MLCDLVTLERAFCGQSQAADVTLKIAPARLHLLRARGSSRLPLAGKAVYHCQMVLQTELGRKFPRADLALKLACARLVGTPLHLDVMHRLHVRHQRDLPRVRFRTEHTLEAVLGLRFVHVSILHIVYAHKMSVQRLFGRQTLGANLADELGFVPVARAQSFR